MPESHLSGWIRSHNSSAGYENFKGKRRVRNNSHRLGNRITLAVVQAAACRWLHVGFFGFIRRFSDRVGFGVGDKCPADPHERHLHCRRIRTLRGAPDGWFRQRLGQ